MGTVVLEQEYGVKDIMSSWMNFFRSRILYVKFRKVDWIWPDMREPHAKDLNEGVTSVEKIFDYWEHCGYADKTVLDMTWQKSGAWLRWGIAAIDREALLLRNSHNEWNNQRRSKFSFLITLSLIAARRWVVASLSLKVEI